MTVGVQERPIRDIAAAASGVSREYPDGRMRTAVPAARGTLEQLD
ncbi:hypothetical protein P376_5079 [Streptomyces sp. HCCB10043]|nr:hypothetical protein P376_5079 [Streptomyces sp. HCCB10043]